MTGPSRCPCRFFVAVLCAAILLTGCSSPSNSNDEPEAPPVPSYEFVGDRVSEYVIVNYPEGYPDSFNFPIRYELRLDDGGRTGWKVYRDFFFHSETAEILHIWDLKPGTMYLFQLRACYAIPGLDQIPANWCSDWTAPHYIEPAIGN